MNSFNYNHLFAFYVVARAGSIKQAAIDLRVSPSTLSEQIKELELNLRTSLFTREGRMLSPNPHGRRLFALVEPFYSSFPELVDSSFTEIANLAKTVEIGITPAVSKAFSFELFRPLFVDSDLRIRVTESSVDSLLPEFRRQSLDILLTHERLPNSLIKRLRSLPLKEPDFVVVGARKFRKLAAKFPESLRDQPFFLFTNRTPLRWEIDRFFRIHGIQPKVRGEVDDVDLLRSAAVDGLGLTVLPHRALGTELREKKIFKLGTLPTADLTIFAYYLADLDPRIERTLALFQKR